MIAAIGTDGIRPVVWGLGETAEAAIADADTTADWRAGGWDTCEVSPALAERIKAGAIDCAELGIAVSVRDGLIVSAEARA